MLISLPSFASMLSRLLQPIKRSFASLRKRTGVMDEVVQKSLKEVAAKQRSSVPWKLDVPYNQPFYTFENDEWKTGSQSTSGDTSITKLAVLSWNIDFMLPFAESRMKQAVSHLQKLVEENREKGSTATVIYLQECVDSDVALIAAQPWIRSTFHLSDIDISHWQSGHYGTISLIYRRLPVISCFRVHYSETRMERDGLFVDVKLQGKKIRLCNTHLESLALEPARRPTQIKLCAEYMHAQDVEGAVAAGDFNAIQEFDRTLHVDNDLKDAYLELGGREDDAAGHTWGQQAATRLRQQFGTSRMDKVYFCGGLKLLSFEKFGAGICVEDGAEKEAIVKLGFDEPWITDHLGVKAVFDVPTDGVRL